MSAIFFPVMPRCARTLCMWILCEVQCILCTIVVNNIYPDGGVVMMGVACGCLLGIRC